MAQWLSWLERRPVTAEVEGSSPRGSTCRNLLYKAQWLSWLERRPVTAEVIGSSPFWVAKKSLYRLFFIFIWYPF